MLLNPPHPYSIFLPAAIPSCSLPSRVTTLPVALQETVELKCAVRANPEAPLEFRWTLNTTRDAADIARAQFSERGTESVLTYTTRTRLDYGVVACAAANSAGAAGADRACVYRIVPAGWLVVYSRIRYGICVCSL